MPVDRTPVSISQFAELMGIDPARFVGVEVERRSSRVLLVLEPEKADGIQRERTTSATNSHRVA
jgi:hypothetical protein